MKQGYMFIFCSKYFAITKYDIGPFYFFSGNNKEIHCVYRSYILIQILMTMMQTSMLTTTMSTQTPNRYYDIHNFVYRTADHFLCSAVAQIEQIQIRFLVQKCEIFIYTNTFFSNHLVYKLLMQYKLMHLIGVCRTKQRRF